MTKVKVALFILVVYSLIYSEKWEKALKYLDDSQHGYPNHLSIIYLYSGTNRFYLYCRVYSL